mgnify:FL=1
MTLEQRVKDTIRDVADFPREGIVFKDLTTLLLDPDLTGDIIDWMAGIMDGSVDAVAAVESRGFWFGPAVAQRLGVPFIPLRKKGKLPGETDEIGYELEYGRATIEVHRGHIRPGWRVWVHDDLLATGGTAVAAAELIRKQDAHVAGFCFLTHLAFLRGEEALHDITPDLHLLAQFK